MLPGHLVRRFKGVFAINHPRFWKAPILESLEEPYCSIGEVAVCSRPRDVKNVDVAKTNQIISHNLTSGEIVRDLVPGKDSGEMISQANVEHVALAMTGRLREAFAVDAIRIDAERTCEPSVAA